MNNDTLNTFGGDNKVNIVKGQLRDYRTQQIFNFEVRIIDNYAMLYAESSKFLKDMLNDGIKRGKNIKQVPGQKLLIEEYPGKTRDEITKEIVKGLKQGGANITKNDSN